MPSEVVNYARLLLAFSKASATEQKVVVDMAAIVTDYTQTEQDRMLAWHTLEDALFPEQSVFPWWT